MPAPLLLLDGASMWFRSYFGVPSSITAPDGRPVNAVRGFLDTVATLIAQQRPGRLGLDLDWRPQFRVDRIPSYKAHRVAEQNPDSEPDVEEAADELAPQIAMIMQILDAFGIATAGARRHNSRQLRADQRRFQTNRLTTPFSTSSAERAEGRR
jgi:5'-3' exonuclease